MFRRVTPATIALLLLVCPAKAQTSHYGKLGDLVVTATAVSTQPARDPDQHYVAVFARVRYGGTDTGCASLSAELHGPNDLAFTEINRSSTDVHWPDPPRVSHVAHGEESTGAFVFEVKNGTEPLELVVKLDSPSTTCDSAPPELSTAPAPEIHLDLHDLRSPVTTSSSSATLPAGGTHGYSYPLCQYCPRAEYSKEAMKAKIQGTVMLVVVVTAEGAVTDVHVQKGLGYGLDANAVAAVSKWRLKPALGPDGQPAAVRENIEVSFNLGK